MVTTSVEEELETPLEKLQVLLHYLGYETNRQVITPEIHYEALLVALDKKSSEEEAPRFVCAIYFLEDVLRNPEIEQLQEELRNTATLQLITHLPLHLDTADPELALKAHQFIQRCNSTLPVGSFGISPEGQFYFRYALKGDDQNLSAPVVIDILSMMHFFLEKTTPLFERLLQEYDVPLSHLVETLEISLTQAPE